MSRWLVALLLMGAAGATAPRDALTALDACIHQLDPGLDVGYARIAARCPDLAPSLAASPWASSLPRDWNRPGNELSVEGLVELRTLLTRPAPAPAVHAPRVERVAATLAALEPGQSAQKSWWARFKQWLRAALERRPQEAQSDWWRRLRAGIGLPRTLTQAIVWMALAAVVALALTIVVNELRLGGALTGWRARATRAAGRVPAAWQLTAAELAEASPEQQPRLVLELIVERLRTQGRLPPARGLTLHEIERAARFTAEADRVRLAALAATCERLRFAARADPPQQLAAALARGRELLAALEGPAAGPQGAH